MNINNKIIIKSRKAVLSWEALPWLLSFITIGIIGVYYVSLPNKVPLYYCLPWGNDQLASQNELFIIPIIALIINTINGILIQKFKNVSNIFLSRVLFVSSIICNLLGGITIIQIIRIIT